MAMRYDTFVKRYVPHMDGSGESLRQYNPDDPEITNPLPGREFFTWTMLDCDGKLVIAAGWHYVNRMFYVRTDKPWTDPDIEVRY